jgi:hypothetical protein
LVSEIFYFVCKKIQDIKNKRAIILTVLVKNAP